MIGKLLDGRYRIVDVLGRGGIGIVYRAQQLHVHDRDVAVKVLSAAASTRASTAHRFENEARIIAKLRHPNTLKLFDTGRTKDGRLYIVTECLHGTPLSDRLREGPMSALDTVQIIHQIAEALIEAHENGIIHRDLKPPNVFLEKVGSQEVVKVLDFGIAKLVDGATVTAPMQIFGTPGFMAPEQCMATNVDPRADLYSLGVLAYLCLSGELPLDGDSVEAVLAATIDLDPIPLRSQPGVGHLEPELEGLVMQLLAKAPGDRLRDALAVSEACGQLIRTLSRTDAVALPSSSSHPVLPAESDEPLAHAPASARDTPPTPEALFPDREAQAATTGPAGSPTPSTPEAFFPDPTAPSRLPSLHRSAEEGDATEFDSVGDGDSDHPGATQLLPKRPAKSAAAVSTTVPVDSDPLDVAPTVFRGPGEAGDTTVNTRVATELSTRTAAARRAALTRNLSLALVSALVAAALASGALYLLSR